MLRLRWISNISKKTLKTIFILREEGIALKIIVTPAVFAYESDLRDGKKRARFIFSGKKYILKFSIWECAQMCLLLALVLMCQSQREQSWSFFLEVMKMDRTRNENVRGTSHRSCFREKWIIWDDLDILRAWIVILLKDTEYGATGK